MLRPVCVLVACVVLCAAPRAQAVVRAAEYFVGPDPGLGQATPIPLTPGEDVEVAFTLDTDALPAGPHRISVRARDNRGGWSPVGHYVFVRQTISGGGNAVVRAAEYFVGPDPGQGQATPIAITPGADVEAAFVLDTAPLPPGPHRIAVRARDSRGAWSPVGHYVFVKQGIAGTGNEVVVAAEYYVGVDPGQGQATPIAITPGADVEAAFVIDTGALTPGPHRISVRARNSRGGWSPVGHYVFVKQSAPANLAVDRVEYFFGADPGVGRGVSVPLTPGPDLEISFVADVSTLAPGPHTVSVRARSSDGAWSLVAGPQTFTVGPNTAYTWTGAAGDGLWTTAGNWSPAGVPGQQDTADTGDPGSAVLLNGNVSVAGLRVNIGGTLSGQGDVTVSGVFTLSAGTLGGTGRVVAQGSAFVASGSLDGRSLDIAGTGMLTPYAGPLTLDGGASLVVASGATLRARIPGGEDLSIVSQGSGGTFVNNGTFQLAQAQPVPGGTLRIAAPFTNVGTTDIAVGTLVFGAAVTNSGVIGGTGTIVSESTATYANSGTIAPALGGVGTLTVSGDIPVGARLEIGLAGAGPGQADVLAVSGTVFLGGTLSVTLLGGFRPALGDAFTVLTYGARDGAFELCTGCDLGNGLRLATTYTATALTLTVEAVGGGANRPPVAVDDVATTRENVAVLIDVLANDSDPDGDALSIAAVGPPAAGTAQADGAAVRYTPAAGFTGQDAFAYTVADGRGATASATVVVTVRPAGSVTVAPPPVAAMGTEAGVAVTAAGFEPTSGQLFYRSGGAATFASVALVPDGAAWRGAVPPQAVTARGVDYYTVLTDGQRSVSFPAAAPQASPAHLRVRVADAASAVVPPPDASYRMVAVPLALDDGSLRAHLTAAYGADPGDGSLWRALRWLPGPGRYADAAADGIAATPGAAFWLATRAETPFRVAGGQSVPASGPFALALAPGWNQIGSPFDFRVAWAGIGGAAQVSAPVAYGATADGGLDYLDPAGVLEPWAGYFVFNGTGAPVTLSVPPVEAPPGAPRVAQASGYRLRLGASVPGTRLRDTQNRVGFAAHVDSLGVAERLRVADLPPVGAGVQLSIVGDGEPLSYSLEPDAGEGAWWDVAVTAAPSVIAAGGSLGVRVRLDDEGERPAGYGVYAFDLDRRVALPGDAFGLTLTPDEPLRRVRVVVGSEAAARRAGEGVALEPPSFALGVAFPNPARGGATIPYTLAEAGEATLEVFDLLGRRVAVLAEGARDSGHHAARWSESGVAPGVYVVRLRAGILSATGRLTVVR